MKINPEIGVSDGYSGILCWADDGQRYSTGHQPIDCCRKCQTIEGKWIVICRLDLNAQQIYPDAVWWFPSI